MPRHIIASKAKEKEQTLIASRKKRPVIYRKKIIQIMADLLETTEAGRQWNNIF